MQERASGLGLGWDRSFFVAKDCVGLGAIDFGGSFPFRLAFSLRAFPFTLLTFLGLVLFSLALIIMPFRFFPCTHRLIPLGVLSLGFFLVHCEVGCLVDPHIAHLPGCRLG